MTSIFQWLDQIDDYIDTHIRIAQFQSNSTEALSLSHLKLIQNTLSGKDILSDIPPQHLTPEFWEDFNLPTFNLGTYSEFENHIIPFLVIAILKCQPSTLNILIQHGLSPNAIDTRGFSGLHICRLFNKASHEAVLRQAGAQDTETHEGLTPDDITHLSLSSYPQPDIQVGEKVLKKFIPFFCFEPQNLPKIWTSNFKVIRPILFSSIHSPESKRLTDIFTNYLNQKYKSYESQDFSTVHCSLPVKIIESAAIPGEYDLIATQDIPPGEIIEYAGIESIDYTPSDRNFSGLNSHLYGNCAQYINDATPKSKYISFNWKGIPRILVLTTAPIKKDEIINIYYGPKHCIRLKNFDHIFKELTPHLTDDFINSPQATEFISFNDKGFFKKTLLHNQLITTHIDTPKTDPEIIDLFLKIFREQTIWSYILTSPIVLCRICLDSGIIISNGLFFDIFQILFDREMKQEVPWALRFYDLLCTLDTVQSGKSPDQLKAIYQALTATDEPIQLFLEKIIDGQ
jgi:hypothetical protein